MFFQLQTASGESKIDIQYAYLGFRNRRQHPFTQLGNMHPFYKLRDTGY